MKKDIDFLSDVYYNAIVKVAMQYTLQNKMFPLLGGDNKIGGQEYEKETCSCTGFRSDS